MEAKVNMSEKTTKISPTTTKHHTPSQLARSARKRRREKMAILNITKAERYLSKKTIGTALALVISSFQYRKIN
jgi:hypothetical protein